MCIIKCICVVFIRKTEYCLDKNCQLDLRRKCYTYALLISHVYYCIDPANIQIIPESLTHELQPFKGLAIILCNNDYAT